MIDSIDMAQEGLEKAHHQAHQHGHPEGQHGATAHQAPPPVMPRLTLFAAVCTAIIAALAVVVEMSANDAQTEYLAHYVAASDLWAQYQAKSVRRTVFAEAADTMEAAAASGTVPPQLAARAAAARADAARMQSDPGHDGMEQLAHRAHEAEAERDTEARRHVVLERAVRGLQIAIVLIGLFLTTRLRALFVLGLALAGAGLVYALVMSVVPGSMMG